MGSNICWWIPQIDRTLKNPWEIVLDIHIKSYMKQWFLWLFTYTVSQVSSAISFPTTKEEQFTVMCSVTWIKSKMKVVSKKAHGWRRIPSPFLASLMWPLKIFPCTLKILQESLWRNKPRSLWNHPECASITVSRFCLVHLLFQGGIVLVTGVRSVSLFAC